MHMYIYIRIIYNLEKRNRNSNATVIQRIVIWFVKAIRLPCVTRLLLLDIHSVIIVPISISPSFF